MVEINPYQTQVLPQGRINTNASPEDFGSQVGESISNLGSSVAGLGAAIYQREIEDEVTDVHIAMSDARRELAQMVEEETNNAPPGDNMFVERVSGKIDSYFKNMEGKYKTREGVKAFSTMSSNLKGMFTYGAVETESRLAAIAAKNGHTHVVDNLSTAAYDDFRQVDDLKQSLLRMINDPKSRYARIDGSTRESLLMEGYREIDRQAAIGFATKYPGAVMETLGEKEYSTLREGYASTTPSGKVPDLKAPLVKPFDEQTIESVRKKVMNPSPYDAMFELAGDLYNIDPKELKLRAVVESGLNPSAKSSQDALGIMQMKKETAASLGVDPMDPKSAIMGAAKLISTYRNKAGGDMSKVDMGYYGGESGTAWGPNTKQYAANMAAARLAIGLGSSTSPEEFAEPWDGKSGREITTGISVIDKLQPDERRRVISMAYQAQEALESQARRSSLDAQTARKARIEAVKDSFFQRIFDPNEDNGGPLDEREILRSPDLQLSDKKEMIGMLEARSKERSSRREFTTDPVTEMNLYSKLYTLDGSPPTLSTSDIMRSYADGKLSSSSMRTLMSELQQEGAPLKKEYFNNRDYFLKDVSEILTMYNPLSTERIGVVSDLRIQLNQYADALEKAGEDPSTMFISGHKNHYAQLPGIRRLEKQSNLAFISSAKGTLNQMSGSPEGESIPTQPASKGKVLSTKGLDQSALKDMMRGLRKGDVIDGREYLGGPLNDPKSYKEVR